MKESTRQSLPGARHRVVTMRQTPTHTVLRWVHEKQVVRLVGKVPEAWLELIRKEGYTIQQAA